MDNPTTLSDLQQVGSQHPIMARQILLGTRSPSSSTFAFHVGGKPSRNDEEVCQSTVTPRRAHKRRTSAEKVTPPAKQRISSALSSAKKSVKDMVSMFETATPTRAKVVPKLIISKTRKTSPNPDSPSKAASKRETKFDPEDSLERRLDSQTPKVTPQQNEQFLSPPSPTMPSAPPPSRDISISITPLSPQIPPVPPPSRAISREFSLNIEHDDPDWALTFQRHQDLLRMPLKESVERYGIPDGPENEKSWAQRNKEIVERARSAIEAESLQQVMEKLQNLEGGSEATEDNAAVDISALGQLPALNTFNTISHDELDSPMTPIIPELSRRNPNEKVSFWASVRDALDISDTELGDYFAQVPDAVSSLEHGIYSLVSGPELPFSDLTKDGAGVKCSCGMDSTENAASEPEPRMSTLSPPPLRIKKVRDRIDGA